MDEHEVDEQHVRAQVIHKSSDGHAIIVRFPNENESRLIDYDMKYQAGVGDFVLVSLDATKVFDYPVEEVEEFPVRIGIVRGLMGDSGEVMLLEQGSPVLVSHEGDRFFDVGNTVQFSSTGIQRVLSQGPFNSVDITTVDSVDLSPYRVKDDPDRLLPPLGGLAAVQERARDLVTLPLAKIDAFEEIGAGRRSGVLLAGPPGTGKTLLARHLAREAGAELYLVNGPEIISKYLGDTEAILRGIFEEASRASKALVVIDEIDSIAPRRDADVHEASQKLVAMLLTLMDGYEQRPNIVVLATTNRPEAIDPALLRAGRLDGRIDFPPLDHGARLEILTVTGRTIPGATDIELAEIAAATEDWTGAELVSIWDEAALLAVRDDRRKILHEDLLGGLQRADSDRSLSQRGAGQ
jgi:transitional endoplasmic reticulum ATPase